MCTSILWPCFPLLLFFIESSYLPTHTTSCSYSFFSLKQRKTTNWNVHHKKNTKRKIKMKMQMTKKVQRKQNENKRSTKILFSCFVLANYPWHAAYSEVWLIYSRETPFFPLPKGFNCRMDSWLFPMSTSTLNSGTPSPLNLYRSCICWYSLCESICALVLLCLEDSVFFWVIPLLCLLHVKRVALCFETEFQLYLKPHKF